MKNLCFVNILLGLEFVMTQKKEKQQMYNNIS